ncbi:MAG: 50S ribosomal protein L6 [Patescibacteria group bacterium]|nr:50S ribosomal protein L6 [Patescibacteria group bacterium]
MSRIGKKQIVIPPKTEVSISGGFISVKGPLGELKKEFSSDIDIKIEDGKIVLIPIRNSLPLKALWGTYASHICNMIQGVTTEYQKKLIVEGIGFKSEVKGNELTLSVGFSHQIKVALPTNLKVTAEKNVISISGIDKESVGQFAAKVRALKKPEPYKGKGIRYDDEVIRRKQGKKSV